MGKVNGCQQWWFARIQLWENYRGQLFTALS